MTTNSTQPQYPVCPICTGFIPDDKTPGAYPGALSRVDNKTRICSDCGTAEAMRSVGRMFPGRQAGKSKHDSLADRNHPERPICPLCIGPIPNDITPGAYPGYLSRVNNKTEICEDCKMAEDMLEIAYLERRLWGLDPSADGA